jgi:hypothetical protein
VLGRPEIGDQIVRAAMLVGHEKVFKSAWIVKFPG